MPGFLSRLKSSNTDYNTRYSMDLCSAIPYFSMNEKRRKEIWLYDGLHLTEKGYRLMGEKIAERLVGILKNNATSHNDEL